MTEFINCPKCGYPVLEADAKAGAWAWCDKCPSSLVIGAGTHLEKRVAKLEADASEASARTTEPLLAQRRKLREMIEQLDSRLENLGYTDDD